MLFCREPLQKQKGGPFLDRISAGLNRLQRMRDLVSAVSAKIVHRENCHRFANAIGIWVNDLLLEKLQSLTRPDHGRPPKEQPACKRPLTETTEALHSDWKSVDFLSALLTDFLNYAAVTTNQLFKPQSWSVCFRCRKIEAEKFRDTFSDAKFAEIFGENFTIS